MVGKNIWIFIILLVFICLIFCFCGGGYDFGKMAKETFVGEV